MPSVNLASHSAASTSKTWRKGHKPWPGRATATHPFKHHARVHDLDSFDAIPLERKVERFADHPRLTRWRDGGESQQRQWGMPDTTRASGGYAHPWQRGLLAAVGTALPSQTIADERPALALHELVVSAHRSIDQHEIAVLVLVLGVMLFAVVTAILFVRTRARSARYETWSRDEIAALRNNLDRANALLLSEPQLMVDWPAASDQPSIDGDPAIVGVAEPHRVLAFGSWLDAGKARAVEHAVEALRTRGESFAMT